MLYTKMVFGIALGIIIHVLVKIRAINNRLQTENYRSVWNAFWRKDWPGVIISLFVGCAMVFMSSEWLELNPNESHTAKGISDLLQDKIKDFLKTISVLVGYCIDAIVLLFFNGTEQKLLKKAIDAGVPMEEIVIVKNADKHHGSPEENSKP